jgi:hypothetical protein
MQRTSRQIGSLHIVIIIVLFIALMATLGIVFYQNFIAPKSETTGQTNLSTPAVTNPTVVERIAFNSDIYELNHLKNWSATVEKNTDSHKGGSIIRIVNPADTIRVTFNISEIAPSDTCDSTDGLKIRYYNVHPSTTSLTSTALHVVEAMSDKKDGGYQYAIGLTQEGGDTHAALDDTHCNVGQVGEASTAILSDDHQTILSPTIIAKIDFPKISGKNVEYVKDMQQVKDMLKTDDYKTAVKVLESARKK